MPDAASLVCLFSLAVLAALPKLFFRPGRWNVRWWATTAPFVVCAAGLLFPVAAFAIPTALASVTSSAAALIAAAGLLLMGVTIGTHQEPPALWHQEVAPARLVTWGPYAHIRHPFYTSYILNLTAALLAAPGALTLVAWGWGTLQLGWTAAREERALLASELGGAYAAYRRRTGRFLPPLVAAPPRTRFDVERFAAAPPREIPS